MKVVLFGADGFCGWPAALYLSKKGHEIVIIDNLSRRKIDLELGCDSLTPIQSIDNRVETWKSLTGKSIRFFNIDMANEYERLFELIRKEKPDAVVHYAEQRAAPYSMKSPWHKRYTLENNLNATHNLLCAIVESELDIHLVHLGSMGVYGYCEWDTCIPEGYIDAPADPRNGCQNRKVLCHGLPASIYHVTKMQDALMFQFYNCNDGIRITDLHQGVVWGTRTEETDLDECLINRFDYDGDYGTFINRFIMQASIGHPLTIYGKGGQCRGIIHIKDSIRCIELALLNPPQKGEPVEIYNQMTEIYKIRDIARIISKKTGAELKHIENPRVEKEEFQFEAKNDSLISLGLKPTKLSDGLIEDEIVIANKYVSRCDWSKILPTSKWRRQK
jgi:UDP-sulfoquinovose synthase